MTELNQEGGVLGAKRATWRTTNPRELLRRIIEENPKADDSEWRKSFWTEVEDEKDYLRAIAEYWLDNNIRSLVSTPPKTIALQRERTARATRSAKENVAKHVSEKIKLALLALTMPNGKELGDCTGSECKQFGGWFAKVGGAVPAKDKVRDHLTETKLQKIWRDTAA